MKSFPSYIQLDQMDCGPTCIKMIAKHYGKIYPVDFLREKSYITREGVSFDGLSNSAEFIGFRSLLVQIDYEVLCNEAPLPCIVHWRQRHFVVVYKIVKDAVYVADPAIGLIKYKKEEFIEGWLYNNSKNSDGYALLLEATPEFYKTQVYNDKTQSGRGLSFLIPYLKPHKKYLLQILLAIFSISSIQLVFPFFTQTIVDYGIQNQNIHFIYIILIGQIVLFGSQTFMSLIRSWILLHIGSRINISIISDFLVKMMSLPISFFESKMIGDLLQRIDDHRRIENFLSSTTLSILFSAFSLVIFGGVLAYYHLKIFFIFIGFSGFYILWVLLFIKRRVIIDYKRHDEASENRSSVIQLIHGMQEIKLNNSERRRRWEWEGIQIKLFKTSINGLSLEQTQTVGANFINELKNIVITFVAATSVIDGRITLGMMLAIQYILGQLNGPINSFTSFVQTTQDAKISIDRLNEIHSKKNEEEQSTETMSDVPIKSDIILQNVSFQYGSPNSRMILQDITLRIPRGKVTAIVGASGSGKTTLLKLLLKFYKPVQGSISVGNVKLDQINSKKWRQTCGVVMQDGFIFADTIARNISESNSEEKISQERLLEAVRIANISDMIDNMPSGFNTNLSWGGVSLSGGEEQRILIARAIYKNPDFLFFDEATSALDANNELKIMHSLENFYIGRTAVIIAHRLSTVKNADQIVVMEKGFIVEVGSHHELVKKRGVYYNLVRNQLELGN